MSGCHAVKLERDGEVDVTLWYLQTDAAPRRRFDYLQKHALSEGKSTLTVVVDTLPKQAGIDPVRLLIDRAPQDNVVAVRAR